MAEQRFVAYYRVSTQKQGRSGLGLEAQRASVTNFLSYGEWKLHAEFTELESGKGSKPLARRPQLRAALELCKKDKAKLVIAKLDRLARNVHFVSGLIESGVEFVAADMPHANKTMIQIYAVMAESERDAISLRTKEALAAAKVRGVILGATGPRNLRGASDRLKAQADAFTDRFRDIFLSFKERGLSERDIAAAFNDLGIDSPRGGKWYQSTVQRYSARLATRPN
jgi:DNA invertase Pin-like site-specific DNA recombinase